MRIQQRALVGFFNFGNDLRHAVGAKEGRAFCAFDLPYFFGHLGALVQQAQKLLIERVDLDAQFAQGVRLKWLRHSGFSDESQTVERARSSLLCFEILKVRHQRLHALKRHGVVNAGTHTTNRFVTFELKQAACFGANQESIVA